MREPYVVFEIQLRVKRGIANFEYPLPNGLKEIKPDHGWVVLEPCVTSPFTGAKEHLQHLMGQMKLLFETYGKNNSSSCLEKAFNELNKAGKYLMGKSPEKRKKEEPKCPFSRAKENFERHRQQTLPTLRKQKCQAEIQLVSFTKEEVLSKTSNSKKETLLVA